jgi:hypothetical protein
VQCVQHVLLSQGMYVLRCVTVMLIAGWVGAGWVGCSWVVWGSLGFLLSFCTAYVLHNMQHSVLQVFIMEHALLCWKAAAVYGAVCVQ